MYADSLDELGFVQHKIETILGQQLVFSKVASSQQEQGLNSTIPQLADQLQIRRNMNTGAISTSFPFTSADLTQEKGVLYGINMHNNGLVIFLIGLAWKTPTWWYSLNPVQVSHSP